MRWWPNNIKHVDIHTFYHSYQWEKCSYQIYFSRVVRHWYSMQEAIKPWDLRWKHMIKWHIDENGRECSVCKQYKQRSEYNKSKSGIQWYMNLCRQCTIVKKTAYREQTNRAKDRAYKESKRKLQIWQKVALCKPIYVDWYPREVIREVMKYELKNGYLLYSPLLKQYTRLSTSDNHNHHQNRLSKRFYFVNDE